MSHIATNRVGKRQSAVLIEYLLYMSTCVLSIIVDIGRGCPVGSSNLVAETGAHGEG